MALGKRIQAIRTRRGFTATDLAQRSGVKLKTLDRIEKRDSRKSIYASAIAEALGISTDALLGGSSIDELLNGHAAARSGRAAGKRIAVQEQVKAREGGKLEAMQIIAPLGFVEVAQVDANMRAIRIRGDALSPAIEDGEILLVRAGVACSPGTKVMIQLKGGDRLCKRLLFERSDAVTVTDLATKEQSTIERATIARMEPIAAIYSADNWRSA